MQSEVDSTVRNIRNAKSALQKKKQKTYEMVGNGIDSGSRYVISASGYAPGIVNGKLTPVKIDVTEPSSVPDTCVWTVSGSSTGLTIRNVATGQYLTVTSSGFLLRRTLYFVFERFFQ